CGFHGGDPTVMRTTVEKALANNVQIGAHPGLPDLSGFGRREMNISPEEAYDLIVYQIGALQGFLSVYDAQMNHVKPHGALYNMAATNEALAEAIAQAVYDISPELVLFGLSGSALTKAGENLGLNVAHEVFADRTYQADGTLTPRSTKGAMITDTEKAIAQVLQFIREGTVHTMQNTTIPLQADTICIHGDSLEALSFVQHISKHLQANHIAIRRK